MRSLIGQTSLMARVALSISVGKNDLVSLAAAFSGVADRLQK